MSIEVVTTTEIRRPRSVVAAFAADPANATQWYVNIKEARWLGEPVLAVGNEIALVAHFLGKRFEYTYVIREYTEGERMVMATEQGPFAMKTTYEWRDAGQDMTRMTLINSGEAPAFVKFGAPVLGRAIKQSNQKDLKNLKHILER